MDKGNDPFCKGYLYKHDIALILKIKNPCCRAQLFPDEEIFGLESEQFFCFLVMKDLQLSDRYFCDP